MKVLNFCLIENKTSLGSQDIESGRWYHWERTVYVETKTHAAFVTMGIFERAIAEILKTCSLGYFDYKAFLLDKIIGLLGEADVENPDFKVNNRANLIGSLSSCCPDFRIEEKAHVPASTKLLRDTYPSFAAYREERESLNEPVDLVIGRGTRIRGTTPNLNNQRNINKNVTKSYRPFTMDCNSDELPDLVRSITAVKLAEFDDSSVDDIYLERIYPPIWGDLEIYFHAFRILKKDGTLVIDFNDGMHSQQQREAQIQTLNQEFIDLEMLLLASLADESYSRSDLNNSQKFVCIKIGDEFSPLQLTPRELSWRNLALKEKIKQASQRLTGCGMWGGVKSSGEHKKQA
ncbi:MAG: hypothetical protein Q8L98_00185 [Chlamydiales bacterium]|nr:hypothetical protein [Chlamydiales bacterium]